MEGSAEDSGKTSKLHHTTLESKSELPKIKLSPVLDQSENTTGLVSSMNGENQSNHVIDMSAYVSPEVDEETEHLLSTSICIANNHNPFDVDAHEGILKSLSSPLELHDNYLSRPDKDMPLLRRGEEFMIG